MHFGFALYLTIAGWVVLARHTSTTYVISSIYARSLTECYRVLLIDLLMTMNGLFINNTFNQLMWQMLFFNLTKIEGRFEQGQLDIRVLLFKLVLRFENNAKCQKCTICLRKQAMIDSLQSLICIHLTQHTMNHLQIKVLISNT